MMPSFEEAISNPPRKPIPPLPSEVLNRFVSTWKPVSRVAFYPSSGFNIGSVFNLDCDAFFFADYSKSSREKVWEEIKNNLPHAVLIDVNDDYLLFEQDKKRGYFFFLDNNQVLDLITRSSISLSTFIGIRDGCSEGGNYECTNKWPYIEKVVNAACIEGMDYYADHSDFLDRYPSYIFGQKRIYLTGGSAPEFNDYQIGPTRHYRVELLRPEVYEWRSQNIRVTIEFDSIHNHLGELDGVICSLLCRDLALRLAQKKRMSWYIPRGSFFRPNRRNHWTANKSLQQIIKLSMKNGWQTIGVTAFGSGDHGNFLSILQSTHFEQPLWLRFFHIDPDDFAQLKSSFTRVA